MSDKNQFTENDTPMTDEPEISAEETLTGESWQTDAPPEDGFHDAETTSEDMIEEESGLDDSYEDASAPSKDRGKTIFYGALGVAALLIGGMVLMQFSGSSQEAPPSAMVSDLAPVTMSERPPAPPETAAAPTAGETDMASLYQSAAPAGSTTVMPDMPAEKEAVTTEIMTLADVAAAPAPAPEPTVAKVENVPLAHDEPVIPPAKPEKNVPAPMPAPTPAPALAPVQESIPVRTSAVPASDVETRLGEMADKIKTLESALEQAAQKNAELVARMETLSVASNTSLEERLARLEQQKREDAAKPAKASKPKASVAKVERAAPVSAPETYDSTAGIVTDLLPEEQVKEAMQQAEPAPAKKALSKKKTTKETKTRKAKESAKATKTSKEAAGQGGLVLRAATPDAAWVSGDAHSHDLQRVTVGETLPGLGKIKEIRQNGESWELVGTEGTLR